MAFVTTQPAKVKRRLWPHRPAAAPTEDMEVDMSSGAFVATPPAKVTTRGVDGPQTHAMATGVTAAKVGTHGGDTLVGRSRIVPAANFWSGLKFATETCSCLEEAKARQ